jgi:hypothetical protein
MIIHHGSVVTIATLERDFYALRRRVNLVVMVIEFKMERRLTEKWDFLLTHFYNCLNKIDVMPYLISEKTFPESHYVIIEPRRNELGYYRKKFKDILERCQKICSDTERLNNDKKHNPSLLVGLNPTIDFDEWMDDMKAATGEVQYILGEIEDL